MSCSGLFPQYEDIPLDVLIQLDEEAIREAIEEMDRERRSYEQEELEDMLQRHGYDHGPGEPSNGQRMID